MLDNLGIILDGWKNVAFPSPEVESIARARAALCAPCPYNVDVKCTKCGCPLIAKTRSMKKGNKCRINKW